MQLDLHAMRKEMGRLNGGGLQLNQDDLLRLKGREVVKMDELNWKL